MQLKYCPDCGCDQPIKNFGKPQTVKKNYKGKTYTYVSTPGYCKIHAYLRNRKSLTRNAATIDRNKKYQKKYNKVWQKTNRKKHLQKPNNAKI